MLKERRELVVQGKLYFQGMRVLHKRFPEGFITGALPQSCMPSPPPTRRAAKKAPPTFLAPDGQHWEFFSRSRILLFLESFLE